MRVVQVGSRGIGGRQTETGGEHNGCELDLDAGSGSRGRSEGFGRSTSTTTRVVRMCKFIYDVDIFISVCSGNGLMRRGPEWIP